MGKQNFQICTPIYFKNYKYQGGVSAQIYHLFDLNKQFIYYVYQINFYFEVTKFSHCCLMEHITGIK